MRLGRVSASRGAGPDAGEGEEVGQRWERVPGLSELERGAGLRCTKGIKKEKREWADWAGLGYLGWIGLGFLSFSLLYSISNSNHSNSN